ncbi:excinuclease ABC subunit UvrA [Kribbella sandramycini]|uniref:UvrABC system protein A n=1 Tax=Kribbella sandramycini TaxID=60450 RepID=A0A7Y4KYB6_9ACTN|nr:excinuclease ABC subunit UvrA [Kribbella sandramycini]MBB6569232.1 excinuclease UvrABC ATPase subunit [Kribbella sandramycini]NOL40927.1 excinuclease ABC subunit UvrA [Kribbella sandramycini]
MLADSHDVIEVRGARENNLAGVSLDIPKRRLTVFTGVSGSGKSSLVFDTIAAESQRLINETYTAFVQNFMPSLARPDVDALQNLSAAIIVDQERIGANSRSTVGTATDAHTMLRVLFSRAGTPNPGPPSAFSFNRAEGMCPTCGGLGRTTELDVDQLVDRELSLNQGAITAPGYAIDTWWWQAFAKSGLFDPDLPLRDYPAETWEQFLHQEPTKIKLGKVSMTFEGLVSKIKRQYVGKDIDAMQSQARAFAARAVKQDVCAECGGTRLNEAARSVTVKGLTIGDCSSMQISDLADFVAGLDDPTVGPVLEGLQQTLGSMVTIGLGYLSLDRESGTLSGGEAQRVKLVRHLGSSLSDVTYVFDEPTVGLHPHDIQRMNDLLIQLRDKGNTVLVVEHKPETIRIADHVVDLGPGAGTAGGRLCYAGDLEGLKNSGSLTGRYLDHRVPVRDDVRRPTGKLAIENATLHNLRDVSVDIPTGVLTVITGVAGSGKSSLVHGSLAGRPGVIVAGQDPIRGSKRSNPATYTGLLDPIRAEFAKANGVKPGLFSANSVGACPSCKGIGLVYTDLAMMAEVASVCEVCNGARFTAEVLAYQLRGKNISEVLRMTVAEAREFFPKGPARAILDRLSTVGLGYIGLGQPLTTLSGGERQRIKLAINMGKSGSIYILDEPTTGLHLADVDRLLAMLDALVDDGNTVIVIEHHLAVMAHADWLIDVGPGAGHDGGQVVFTGTPADLVESSPSLTAEHLRAYVRQ